MKKILLLIFSMAFTLLAIAQKTVTGTVTDSNTGEPIPGANIIEKGTTNGTITDFDGKYRLNVPENTTLTISYVGYEAQEIVVGNRFVIDVSMKEDVQALSEVVVIGYGQIEKRDATGSVASVKSDDFNGGVIATPEQLFQGKAAGVQITTNSGEPGSGVSIRIRGSSSVRSGNEPLFVVDGIPLTSSNVASGGVDMGRGTSAASNPLTFLNPNDIESIDILKDASATAIYGSRGANGVIIITTKSGKGAQSRFTYSGSTSVSTVARTLDLLNAGEFLDGAVARGAIRSELDFGADTDWQEEIYKPGISHQHDLSYSDSYNSGDYRAGISYSNQGGVMEKSNLERLNGRLNLNQRFLDDKLKLGLQGTFSRIRNSQLPLTDDAGFEGDLLAATYMANPTWEADPTVQPSSTNLNPLSMIEYTQDQTVTMRGLIGASLDYEIFSDLSVRVNGGFDRANALREAAISGDLNMGSQSVVGNGVGAISDWDTESDLFEAVLNYDKEFDRSQLTAVVGYSYQEFRRSGVNNQGWGFNTTDMDQMISDLHSGVDFIRSQVSGSYQQWGYDADGNPDENIFFVNRLFPGPSTDIDNTFSGPAEVRSASEDLFNEIDALQSYFGRLNYTINDKYLLTGTVRADGSSKFGGNNKYGIFPSFAAAWRLSDEEFIPNFFQDLKVRAGWGITGNQEIPHNLHTSRQRYGDPDNPIGPGDGGQVAQPGLNTITFANPDLKWEETVQLNFGLDFGLIDGKLNGTLDFYNKTTTNLLIKVTSAQPAPQEFFWTNLDAEVENKGVEVTLNYTLLASSDLNWNVSGNYSYNTNEVTGLLIPLNTGAINGQGLTNAFAQRISNGQPLYAYYLREFAGFDENGISIYEGEEVQRFIGKSPLPKSNVGLSTDLSYKRWNFSLYTYGQFGHYVYNNTENALFTSGSLGNGRNVTRNVLTSGESNLNAPDVSTRFLEKGDFVRIQNLMVGYNFDMSDRFISDLRIALTAQNLFLIAEYSGIDPEVNSNKAIDDIPSFGIEYSPYPRPRTYTLSLSASF